MNHQHSPAYTSAELEDLLCGALPAQREQEILALAKEDQELANYLQKRREDAQNFLLAPERRSFASLLEEANSSPPWWRKTKFLLPVLLSAATAAATMVMVPQMGSNSSHIRHKGGLSVKVALLNQGGSQLLKGGETLQSGDRLRLTIDDPHGGYPTVILEESSGQVQLLYSQQELGELSPGTHILPDSLLLDEATGKERLYIILSSTPPNEQQFLKELNKAHQKGGFNHGWLPPRGSKLSVIEYTKGATQ